MAQLLSNEEEVLEAFDPSIAASRRFKYVLLSALVFCRSIFSKDGK
jgi:hypothetical protein